MQQDSSDSKCHRRRFDGKSDQGGFGNYELCAIARLLVGTTE